MASGARGGAAYTEQGNSIDKAIVKKIVRPDGALTRELAYAMIIVPINIWTLYQGLQNIAF